MASLVYFYREMSEYIRIELDLLAERHDVTAIECASRWPRPLLLLRLIGGCDLAASWFASWHSFVPALLCRLLGKPFVLNAGGYDTARLPEVAYGHQRGGLRRLVSRSTLRLATRVLVCSEFARSEVRTLGVPDDRIRLVFLGIDPERYPPSAPAREDLVVTVAGVNHSNRTRKGLDAFVRAAALLPELRFVVIGAWMDDSVRALRSMASPNVHFTGRVTHEEKVDWLGRARVVVQASLHEAFGLALAEGMLCGCVPVITRAGALPEVAGDCGVAVESQEPSAVAAGIRRALGLGPAAGARPRERVRSRFGIAQRRVQLHGLLDELLAPGPSSARASTTAPRTSPTDSGRS